MTCLSTTDKYPEPSTYEQAVEQPEWVEAMKKKIDALQNNNTWDVVTLSKGKKAISCKWVLK